MLTTKNPFAWEDSFPPVYGHTSVSYLMNCPGFERAKKGDMAAAESVVQQCVKPELIEEITHKYSGSMLLPIIAQNKLPEALAKKIGMNTHKSVFIPKEQNRKGLSAMERFMFKPCFNGDVIKGTSYVIVDDIVTQGGTISALRKYIIICGGSVAAVAALAFSAGSRIIPPEPCDIYELRQRFTTELIQSSLRKHRIADDISELTRSEVKYLLRFKQSENMLNKMNRYVRMCKR